MFLAQIEDAVQKGAKNETPANETFENFPPNGNYVRPTLGNNWPNLGLRVGRLADTVVAQYLFHLSNETIVDKARRTRLLLMRHSRTSLRMETTSGPHY
jgi:hypothetical protein